MITKRVRAKSQIIISTSAGRVKLEDGQIKDVVFGNEAEFRVHLKSGFFEIATAPQTLPMPKVPIFATLQQKAEVYADLVETKYCSKCNLVQILINNSTGGQIWFCPLCGNEEPVTEKEAEELIQVHDKDLTSITAKNIEKLESIDVQENIIKAEAANLVLKTCEICGKTFKNEHGLNMHKTVKHAGASDVTNA